MASTTQTPHDVTATGARGDANSAGSGHASSVDDQVGEKLAPTLSKRQQLQRHCGRFWLWYLIGAVIFLAIFLPILFKLIIPAIVQAIINGQGLPIKGGSLQVVSADQVLLAINTTINTPIPARIDNVNLDLYNKDTMPVTPFGNITINGTRIGHDTPVNLTPELVDIKNQTELVKFLKAVYASDTVELAVKGDPVIHLGALTSTARINQVVQLPGLKRFSGFGIDDLKLVLPPDSNGNNLKGALAIPNPGILTLNFGNITFDITSGATKIGQITVYDVILKPGNNSLSFDGTLDLPTIVQNLGPVLQSQTAPLNRGQVELNATGRAVYMNGQRIPYIEEVLGTQPLTASVSVITLISDVINGFIGGGDASIVNVLGDVVGNNTFLTQVLGHFNQSQSAKALNATQGSMTKRAPNPRDALMWSMLKMGLRAKLNQVNR